MTIFVEVIDERLEVTYSDVPGQRYHSSILSLIYEAASELYRRGERDRWFGRHDRPPLVEMNGRPC